MDVPPAAAPTSSARSDEEQEVWLPPASVGLEVAYIPTIVGVAYTPIVVDMGLAVAQTAQNRTSSYQPWVIARRPNCWCLSLLICFVSQVGVLLSDSPIDQLTERVELEH